MLPFFSIWGIINNISQSEFCSPRGDIPAAVVIEGFSKYCFRLYGEKKMEIGIESDVIEDEQYRNLFLELSEYERMGVRMKMNGHPASPLQIASAHAVREQPSYMRDYVADENGKVKEVRFVKLSDLNL